MAALSQTAANFIPSANAVYSPFYTFGATVTAGQPCYLDASNLIQLADSNASLLAATAVGFAAQGGSSGQQGRLVLSDPALAIGCTLVIGDTIWLHTTAGSLTKTAADNTTGVYTCCFGVAVSTTAINMKITTAGAVTP